MLNSVQKYYMKLRLEIYLNKSVGVVVVVLLDPFRGMGAWRNSMETQQSATPQGLDQRSKMEVVPKMARRRGSDAGHSRKR